MKLNEVDGPRSWLVAFAAMACLIVGPSTLLVASFGVLVGPLADHFGWSRGQIGAAISVMAVAIVIVSPLQGVLIDRVGTRRLVLLSVVPFVALLVSMRFLPANLGLFYAAWFLLPFASIGLWPASYLKTVSGWFDRRLGAATGIANAGIGFGTILVPPVIAWTILRFGVMNAFLTIAVLAFLALPLAALFIKENRVAPVARRVEQAGAWSYRDMARNWHYRLIAASFLMLGITGTGLMASIVPILSSKGVSLEMALGGMSAFGAMALFGRLATGVLLDRFHVSTVMWLLAGSSALALVVLSAGGAHMLSIGAVATLGLLSGGEFNVLAYALRRYFGLASFGKMYGAAFAIFQFGGAIGAATLAASVTLTQSYDASLIFMAFAAGVSALLLGIIGAYPARPITPDGAFEAG